MTIDISFIIPCRNEENHLESCLLSINRQSFPREKFEIIVVDNGSTDNSKLIAQKHSDKLVNAPNLNVGAVRNTGARAAQGTLLVFIDADCTLDIEWLNRAKRLADKNGNTVFGGGILLPKKANWLERSWLLEGSEGNTLPKDLIGCSILIKKNIFQEVEGFNESKSSGEDTELSLQCRHLGKEIKITRELNVTHHGNAKTQVEFIKRQIWHAQSYKNSIKSNLKDPIFLATLTFLSTLIAALILSPTSLKSGFLLFLATAATAVSLTIKRHRRAKLLIRTRRPKDVVLSVYCDVLYLLGRSIGILKASKKLFTQGRANHR